MSRTVEVERHSRRDFLKWGATAVAAVAVVGVGGKIFGENEVRGQLLQKGDLSPELRKKLETAGYFVYEPRGETIANLRKSGMDIPPFPLTAAEGQPDPETVPSKRKWMAVKPGEFYRLSEEGATPKDLDSLVTRQSTDARTLDSSLQAVIGEDVDLLGLEHEYLLSTGETLFTEAGFVLTATKVGTNRLAIGRSAPDQPLSYSIVDTSSQDPIPPTDELRGVGVVVAR